MGHGKETPRQKMIGMMYLVLTALLALNVSAEVLNAFTLIDSSLRKSARNAQAKNDAIYTEFVKAMELNETRVKPYKEKADQVKQKSDELFKMIQDLKVKIVKTVDGPDGDVEHIKKKDDNNVGGQIMILEGNGLKLKKAMEDYREFLVSLVEDTVKSAGVVHSIRNNLYTGEIISPEGEPVPWEVAHFEHLPVAGVIALMSKMQGDIRNSESEIISYLLNQIGATDMKFNTIKAIVNSKTGYVLKGQPYEAEIFIAAYDSTQDPDIYVNGQKIKVENGRGIYRGNTSTVGIKRFAGVIKLFNPATGDTTDYPFESEYQVAEPSVSVSPTKMNVFYVGVANPVDITASGVPDDKLMVSLSGAGTIKKSGKGYTVWVKQAGKKVYINVSAKLGDGSTKQLGRKEFRVKRVPDPVAVVGRDPKNKRGGAISKSMLLAQPGVKAELENFDFDLKFRVTGFTVSATIKGFTEEERSRSAAFTSKQKALIRKVAVGKKVYIENVTAKGPDGSTRRLGTLTFVLR